MNLMQVKTVACHVAFVNLRGSCTMGKQKSVFWYYNFACKKKSLFLKTFDIVMRLACLLWMSYNVHTASICSNSWGATSVSKCTTRTAWAQAIRQSHRGKRKSGWAHCDGCHSLWCGKHKMHNLFAKALHNSSLRHICVGLLQNSIAHASHVCAAIKCAITSHQPSLCFTLLCFNAKVLNVPWATFVQMTLCICIRKHGHDTMESHWYVASLLCFLSCDVALSWF